MKITLRTDSGHEVCIHAPVNLSKDSPEKLLHFFAGDWEYVGIVAEEGDVLDAYWSEWMRTLDGHHGPLVGKEKP